MSLKELAINQKSSFLPIWLFPFIFYIERAVSAKIGHPNLLFWVVSAPVFIWSIYKVSSLLQNGVATSTQLIVLAGVVPVLVWAALVYVGNSYGL